MCEFFKNWWTIAWLNGAGGADEKLDHRVRTGGPHVPQGRRRARPPRRQGGHEQEGGRRAGGLRRGRGAQPGGRQAPALVRPIIQNPGGGTGGGGAHVPEGRLRPARDGAARRPGAGADGEHPDLFQYIGQAIGMS